MKKKALALLLATAMCTMAFAGCGNSGSSDGSSTGESGGSVTPEVGGESETDGAGEAQEPDFSEHREITVWLQADDYMYYSSYDENPVTTYLNEKFNMTLKFQQPAMGSEADQFSLMMGTGDYTDIMYMAYSQESIDSLLSQGVIQDMTPYEKYLPNYIAYLNQEGNEQVRDLAYSGDKLAALLMIDAVPGSQWGGMVYRRDILETMTGGNVEFPSGNEEPTTVEDWDYMLELMKKYFDAAGMADSACLILPSGGYFGHNGAAIMGGFGTSGTYYIEDGEVVFGPTTEQFYNYLVKMREWYEKGYIYKDFASRTQDIFFLPNTALTYGGAAGIWYGLTSQLGDAMSMPEYGLEMEVRPLALPLDEAHGITGEDAGYVFDTGRAGQHSAFCVSKTCSEENLIRYLQAMDYMYTEEGGLVKTLGLTAEQANGNEIYATAGINGGTYSINDDGSFCFEYGWDENAENSAFAKGLRYPGIYRNDILNEYFTFTNEVTANAEEVWTCYGRDKVYPFSISPSDEDSDRVASINTRIYDYINSEVPKFIMGTNELNETTFQAYVDQINALGLEEFMEVYRALYADFVEKYEK